MIRCVNFEQVTFQFWQMTSGYFYQSQTPEGFKTLPQLSDQRFSIEPLRRVLSTYHICFLQHQIVLDSAMLQPTMTYRRSCDLLKAYDS